MVYDFYLEVASFFVFFFIVMVFLIDKKHQELAKGFINDSDVRLIAFQLNTVFVLIPLLQDIWCMSGMGLSSMLATWVDYFLID